MNMNEKKWSVEIVIDEHDADEGGSKTRAQARLRTRDTHTLVGVGLARRNPADTEIPEIGDELATARALADLAHQLIELTAADVEAATHSSVHLTE
ncbi:DUF1876 domain-containing protein [Rhodococcus opacus]|uniref:DUF1876 domain-containing protein n=4 Tax=Rhodococcus opacus TaxID=37919 RepID=A0AAX3YRZ6_RHOOP|nr:MULTISPECIES: DUF1876 domain-containing protein [Rhodococcus]ELB88243.1 hypothetical protein Rwratislav_35689 [Rhodococcus wratislaviensis IFP 2016]NHU46501.1 DUF1876 domain-containing protein [Rhodococcus sp. A14]EID77877.1 hypothetical protein W59_21038 [Rhodococcus opacus RKJ300 = JCM 13270]EKT81488.1 hypothetical protein WSS_A17076 [Rhodococcus opacus M213]MCZ4584331.1 DUF1876 domain-containing protein [Rhodococcus opacus]